MHVIVMEIR